MALLDPQPVTISGVPHSLPRIDTGPMKATYQTADSNLQLVVSHQQVRVSGKPRVKSLARLTKRAIVPDPLTAVNDYETVSVHVVIDRPEAGFSAADIDALVTGFKTWLSSSMVTSMVGFQS